MSTARKALVTGGAGFIGSGIAHALLEQGTQVRILDNLSTGNEANLADIADDIELIRADIRDIEATTAAMIDIDVVFHEAALTSVPRSVANPIATHDVNASGTLNVLVAARDAGVERLVYASSSSVYGDAELLPVEESMPARPISPYGVSKLAGEHYVRAFHLAYGIATVSLRYFNVFGPRQDPASEYAAVVPRFIVAALEGRAATIYGDGGQARDFTYVGDVVAANLLAATAPETAWGRTFNIAYNDSHSVRELWEQVQAAVPAETVEPTNEPSRTGDIRDSRADISAAKAVLGYRPASTFEEGVRMTAGWLTEQTRKTVR